MTVIKNSEMMVQNNTDGDLNTDPFAPLYIDDIMEKLAKGREQNQNGEGIPFEEAMKKLGRENHFID